MTEMPKITQEMIDLYDRFTHVTNDRADFMARLTALAGSPEIARIIADRIAASPTAALQVAENDPRIKSQTVKFPAGSGEMAGYLAWPANASGKLPAVMVVHENRGLVPHIKDVVRRMALEGFLAFGPDFLHSSGGTPEDEDKGRDMIGALKMPVVTAQAVDTVKYLKNHASSTGNVGCVGYCWGGGVANNVAVAAGADLKATAPFYGRQPGDADVPKIKAAVQLHYAGLDERINAGIDAYKAAMDKAGIKYEVFIYDGAQHAFNNDASAERYHPEAAKLSWQRTVAFFKKALG